MNLAILLVLGMAICAQGGIGRVAAAGQWAHPLAILGYLLGAAILILAAAVFFNVKLPLITSQAGCRHHRRADGREIVDSVGHSLLSS